MFNTTCLEEANIVKLKDIEYNKNNQNEGVDAELRRWSKTYKNSDVKFVPQQLCILVDDPPPLPQIQNITRE